MGYEMTWEAGGVRIRCFGKLTDDDLLRSNAAMYADPRYGPSIRYQLMDATAVTEVDVKADTVRACALQDRGVSKRFPDCTVLLAAPQKVLYGLSRLYQMQLEPSPWRTEVFPDLAAAHAWLASHA